MATPFPVIEQKPVETDPTKEYLVGGNVYSLFSGALTPGVDELDPCIGLELYAKMARDPDAWAALLLLKILVLADGLQIQPSVAKPEMPGYERAKDIADFSARSVAGMRPGIMSVFEEKLDALIFGNKISEVTLKDGSGPDRGKLVFASIKAKPYNAVQFVVDRFWNLLGFLPTWAIEGSAQRVLPPEKFFYFSLHVTNNDPRGNSSLRPMVDAWKFKQNLWPTYDKWMKLQAIHKLIAKVKNGAKLEAVTDASGKPVTEGGKPKMISRSRAVLNALVKMENATVAVVDGEDEVEAHETTGTGEHFDRGFGVAGRQITKTLLLQELATLDSKHQTKGSTASQSQYIDLIVWYLKNRLIEEFRRQPLTTLVQVNYGDDAAREFLPLVSMGDSERKDWAKDGKALRSIGDALTDSQWLQGTDQLGFKRPDEGETLPKRTRSGGSSADEFGDDDTDDEDEA